MHPPAADELEISVFGPGYGESVIIHVGNGVWFCIDSCIDPRTGRPAPIDYLEAMGVDPAAAIDFVIASHWHDDHVRGLHDLFLAAKRARFSCSFALTKKEFVSLANLYARTPSKIPSGPDELYRCLMSVRERENGTGEIHHRWATTDKLLWQSAPDQPVRLRLTALSPSDAMLTRTQQFMFGYLEAVKKGYSEPRLLPACPNDVAVALLLEVGNRQILFGSDLEQEANQFVGWSAVMASETAKACGKSCAFKVAHHGAESGHSDQVWNELLENAPLALLTPFRHGNLKIPTQTDRQRILNRTGRAYISANPYKSAKLPKKATKVQAFVDNSVSNRRLANGPLGQVRWRASLSDPADQGKIELFGEAVSLTAVTETT